MKSRHLLILTTAFAGAFALTSPAQENPSLTFPISVAGQAATAKAGEPFARIDKPVPANAAIEVDSKSPMIIINVTSYDLAKKQVTPGAAPAIILLQGTQKGSLDKTMDGHKLTAGNYLLSVTADSKTDTVLLQVQ